MSKVRIVMFKHGRGEVFIDGERVENVRAVKMSAGVDELNQVEITLTANELEFEGEVEVTTIQDEHRRYVVGRKAVDSPPSERGF